VRDGKTRVVIMDGWSLMHGLLRIRYLCRGASDLPGDHGRRSIAGSWSSDEPPGSDGAAQSDEEASRPQRDPALALTRLGRRGRARPLLKTPVDEQDG